MSGIASAAGFHLGLALTGFLWTLALASGRQRPPFRFLLAAAYPAGAFVLTGTWFALLLAGLRLDRPLVLGSLALLLAAGAILVALRRDARPAPIGRLRARPLEAAAGLALLLALLFQARDLITVPYGGDGLGFWRPKALILAQEGTVRSPFFTHPAALNVNRDYPLLLPLLQAGLRVLCGPVPPEVERSVFPPFLLSLFLLGYAGLRRWCAPLPALALLLNLAMASHGRLQAGYADLPLSCYLLGSLVCALSFAEPGAGAALRPGALLAAGMLFTKREGLLYFALLSALAAWTVGRRGAGPGLRAVLLTLLLGAPWLLFQASLPPSFSLDLLSHLRPGHLLAQIPKVPYVLLLLLLELLSVRSWGAFWLVTAWAWRRRPPSPLLHGLPLAAGSVWLVAAVATPPELSWSLYTGDRFLFHLAMPALLLSGRALAPPGSRAG